MRFNSEELHQVVSAHGGKLKVKVKYSPSDIRTVYVFSPLSSEYVPVHCTSPEYSSLSEISLWEHRGVLKAAKLRNKEVNDAILVASSVRLSEERKAKNATARTKSRRKTEQRRKRNYELSLVGGIQKPSDKKSSSQNVNSSRGSLRESESESSEERFKRYNEKAEELIFGVPKKRESKQ